MSAPLIPDPIPKANQPVADEVMLISMDLPPPTTVEDMQYLGDGQNEAAFATATKMRSSWSRLVTAVIMIDVECGDRRSKG